MVELKFPKLVFERTLGYKPNCRYMNCKVKTCIFNLPSTGKLIPKWIIKIHKRKTNIFYQVICLGSIKNVLSKT